MPISHEHKLVFVHIPKNAGTAITHAQGMNFQHIGHHVCLEYMNLLGRDKWEDYYKFSVVRNPWDRVLSNYKYARMIKSYWHSTDGSTPYKKHADYDICSNLSFEKCVKLLWEQPEKLKHMGWGSQFPYICDSKKQLQINKYFLYHKLHTKEFTKLIPNLEKINISEGSNMSYLDFYTDELIEIVSEIYHEDILLFNLNFYNV